MKKVMILMLMGLCGCEQMPEAPETGNGTNSSLQVVERHQNIANGPDYYILRDSKTGYEYIVFINGGNAAAVVRRCP